MTEFGNFTIKLVTRNIESKKLRNKITTSDIYLKMIQVCMYNKYGYCKKGDNCNNIHFSDICEDMTCSKIYCDKRHPKSCSYYEKIGYCKFTTFCSYLHVNRKLDTTKIKDELEIYKNENMILKEKILSLEVQIKEMNNNKCSICN